MKTITQNLAAFALVPAAFLILNAGCSSTPKPPPGESSSHTAYEPGVPGGIKVQTQTVTATVTAIDAEKRTVTIVDHAGEKTLVKCGPEVVNFDQIRVGDQLKVRIASELVVFVAPAGATLPADSASGAIALAPEGAKPGGVLATTTQVTATVKAIDVRHHRAVLQFADGTVKTIAVRPDVDLSQRQVGEQVVIRKTENVAVSVEKP